MIRQDNPAVFSHFSAFISSITTHFHRHFCKILKISCRLLCSKPAWLHGHHGQTVSQWSVNPGVCTTQWRDHIPLFHDPTPHEPHGGQAVPRFTPHIHHETGIIFLKFPSWMVLRTNAGNDHAPPKRGSHVRRPAPSPPQTQIGVPISIHYKAFDGDPTGGASSPLENVRISPGFSGRGGACSKMHNPLLTPSKGKPFYAGS